MSNLELPTRLGCRPLKSIICFLSSPDSMTSLCPVKSKLSCVPVLEETISLIILILEIFTFLNAVSN